MATTGLELNTFALNFAFNFMVKQKITFLFALFLLSGASFAQTPRQVEDSVNHYLEQLASSGDNAIKLSAHEDLKRFLSRALLKPEVFHHSFSTVNKMAILGNPEAGIRIWSWHVPLRNASPGYGCFIVQYDAKKDMCKVHELEHDVDDEWRDRATYQTSSWPGALYYEMEPVGKKRPDYYLLFGWDGNDDLSNKKVVEVLHFSSGKPKLGKALFVKDGKSLNRLVFEYREDAVFSVGYYPDMDMIIYDDFGPPHPSLDGKPAHYVPLGSFSGYQHQKGKWAYQNDIDFKRERDERDKNFNDPAKPDAIHRPNKVNPLTGE